MATIRFDVVVPFDAAPRAVWDELVDWKGHERWIPATRVEVDAIDPSAVGTEFVAWTGVGPLSLEDRMRVTLCTWRDDSQSGDCEVEKLGPVLRGRAGFTVAPTPDGARVEWFEDVSIRRVPQFLSPVFAAIGAFGFRMGMRSLGKQLRDRVATT